MNSEDSSMVRSEGGKLRNRTFPSLNFNSNWGGGFNPLNGIKQGCCEAVDVSWHILKRHFVLWKPFTCVGFITVFSAFGWATNNVFKPVAGGAAAGVLGKKVSTSYPVAGQISNTAVRGTVPVITGVVTGTVNTVGKGLQLTAAATDAYFQTEYAGGYQQQPNASQYNPAKPGSGPEQNTALVIWNSPNVQRIVK